MIAQEENTSLVKLAIPMWTTLWWGRTGLGKFVPDIRRVESFVYDDDLMLVLCDDRNSLAVIFPFLVAFPLMLPRF